MQITNNIFISFVTAGRTTNEIFEQWELDAATHPRFGRNWWYWFPSLHSNGGKFRSYENTDINFHWLCFSISLTVFASKRKPTSRPEEH